LHVPAGAIPKDGPSAGVAMVSTIASLVLNKPVDAKLAMTGEITLRGAVMPVGGIKEKVIAAHRAGIRKVLLPKRNERDLKDVPDEVRQGLEFVFADTVEEALHHTLGLEPTQWSGAPLTGPASSAGTGLGADHH
jgi:ATP-dependent Lon protease